MTVTDHIARIQAWLREHHPAMLNLFQKPATKKALKQLEKDFGHPLPDDFKEAYLLHDGTDMNSGVLVGIPWMPLDAVTSNWESWADIADDLEVGDDLSEDCESRPEEAIQRLYADRHWLPFAGDPMHYIALDYDPGPKGHAGQVINAGRDDNIRHVVAPTVTAFFAFVADLFEAGKVALNPNEDADDPRWLGVKGKKQDLLTGIADLLPKKPRAKKS